jgi:hypothetical protein
MIITYKIDVRYCEHIDIDNTAQNAKIDLSTSESQGLRVCWIDVLSCFAVRNALLIVAGKNYRTVGYFAFLDGYIRLSATVCLVYSRSQLPNISGGLLHHVQPWDVPCLCPLIIGVACSIYWKLGFGSVLLFKITI